MKFGTRLSMLAKDGYIASQQEMDQLVEKMKSNLMQKTIERERRVEAQQRIKVQ